MASKVVIAAAGVASVAYYAREAWKDREVRAEEEKKVQEEKEFLEARARKMQNEEAYGFVGAHNASTHAQTMIIGESLRQRRTMLADAVASLHRSAVSVNEKQKQKHTPLHLPLLTGSLGDEQGRVASESVIAFAAALALSGDSQLLDEVLRRDLVITTPGLVMSVLSSASIHFIREHLLNDYHMAVPGYPICGSTSGDANTAAGKKKKKKKKKNKTAHTHVDQQDQDQQSAAAPNCLPNGVTAKFLAHNVSKPFMGALLSRFVFNKAEDGKAVAMPYTLASTKNGLVPVERQLVVLTHILKNLGLHLDPLDNYVSKTTKGGKFIQYTKLSSSQDVPGRVRQARGPRARGMDKQESTTVLVKNFSGDFKFKAHRVDDTTVSHDTFDDPIPFTQYPYCGLVHTFTEEQELGMLALMTVMQAGSVMEEAVARLDELGARCSISERGVSLEHISTVSGSDNATLREMRTNETDVIEENVARISGTMSEKLLAFVPSPEADLSTAKRISPTPSLRAEVGEFVKNYTDFLIANYCIVPRVGGKAPSSCVPDTDITDGATGWLLTAPTLGVKRITRQLELDERRRLVRARELASPSLVATVICCALVYALFNWLAYLSVVLVGKRLAASPFVSKKLLGFDDGLLDAVGWLPVLIALYVPILIMPSLFAILKGPLMLQDHSSYGEGTATMGLWTMAKVVAEAVGRLYATWMEQPTPFDQHVAALETACLGQHAIWTARCAEREFFEALRTKHITWSQKKKIILALCWDGDKPSDADVDLLVEGTFRNGSQVVLTGLKSARFNGTVGLVTAFDPSTTPPRYVVEVDGASNLRVKRANLRLRGDAVQANTSHDAVRHAAELFLPGTTEEAAAFLNLDTIDDRKHMDFIDDRRYVDGGDNTTTHQFTIEDVFKTLSKNVTECTQIFVPGSRVSVAFDPLDAIREELDITPEQLNMLRGHRNFTESLKRKKMNELMFATFLGNETLSVIPNGSQVELTGLKSARFNGTVGLVTAFDPSTTPPRYEVEVDGAGNLRVKRANLRLPGDAVQAIAAGVGSPEDDILAGISAMNAPRSGTVRSAFPGHLLVLLDGHDTVSSVSVELCTPIEAQHALAQ